MDTPAEIFDESLFTSGLFDVVPIALAIVDPQLRVRRANRALKEINGLSDADMATTPVPDLLPRVDPEAWAAIRQVFATGEPVLGLEIIGRTPASWPQRRVWEVSHYPLPDERGLTRAVGLVLLDVTDHRLAQLEREMIERRMRLLTRASAMVGASLDLPETIKGIAELVVPEFADHCTLGIAEKPFNPETKPDRIILRWAFGAEQVPFLSPHNGIVPGVLVAMYKEHPIHRAIETGRPVRYQFDELTEDSFEFLSEPTLVPQETLDFDFGSIIAAPLLVGREVHGIAYFACARNGRVYTEGDVETAAELSNRIASAVANAAAYTRERIAAITLQRGLLPRGTPPVEGLEIAWRYEPGTANTEVGGDWFDVIPLSTGRVALVIGDVIGRGLTAAAIMGQVRTATRAFAALDLPAADVLTHLDNLVASFDVGMDGALVSCVYAIFEPTSATLTIANAGHLPPALRQPDGTIHIVENKGGGILGIGGQTFGETRHPFGVGTTLALYTDGLVESHSVDIDEGTRRLCRALEHPDALSATADGLMTLLDRAGSYDDDVAMLLVRAATPTTTQVVTCDLTADPRTVGRVRDAIANALCEWKLADVVDTVQLLVSELVTNAIRYSRSPGELVLRHAARALYVDVSDDDSRVPHVHHPTDDDEHGRGLLLVNALATRWGTRPTSTGKVVWCQLDTV